MYFNISMQCYLKNTYLYISILDIISNYLRAYSDKLIQSEEGKSKQRELKKYSVLSILICDPN